MWSVEIPKVYSGLYLLSITPEQPNVTERKEPELLEDYGLVSLSIDERIAAIRNFLKWFFKPQLSGCFDKLEIIAQEGYDFFGRNMSYGYGLDRIKASNRAVIAFAMEADAWVHEGFHHVDLSCNATDNKLFRAIYEAIPESNEYKQSIENVLRRDYLIVRPPYSEEQLWNERRGLTIQMYFNPKYRHLVPSPMAKFLETYVQEANLPKDDYFRVSLKDFVKKK